MGSKHLSNRENPIKDDNHELPINKDDGKGPKLSNILGRRPSFWQN